MAKRVKTTLLYPSSAHTADNHLRDQIRLEIAAVRLAKDQILVFVVSEEQPAVLLLLGTEELNRRNGRLRHLAGTRLPVLRRFDPQPSFCLFKRFVDFQG